MHRKINTIVALLFIFPVIQLTAQTWPVPEDQSANINPVDYTLSNVKKGKDLYQANCKSCHGDPGKNNALPLVPPPPDVASELMQANSEGDLFFKITTGRVAMPQFETVLSEDERWKVVNYIMNYSSKRQALLIEKPPVRAQIWASVNEEDASIEVFVESLGPNGETKNLMDVPVLISSKKTFGNLRLGEIITNENGRSEFIVPHTIIGDEEGKVSFVVSLNEDYDANAVVLENAKIATPKEVTKLIHQGVIWSTNENMPLWLVGSFLALVAGAWITIVYVIIQIFKIRKLSRVEES